MKNDPTGRRYGRLLAIARVEGSRPPKWECKCDCGKAVNVDSHKLIKGKIVSCGCHRQELATKHGLSKTPEYKVWAEMKGRCSNPKHKAWRHYGGRGIKVCNRWESFEGFISDMGRRPSSKHTIDRIDNNRGYEPGNCRWATVREQGRNRRNNCHVTINGETKTVAEWCEHYGIPWYLYGGRINLGWSQVDALTLPKGCHPEKRNVERLKMTKLMTVVLTDIQEGRGTHHNCRGLSEHGGRTRILVGLRRREYIDEDYRITSAGLDALGIPTKGKP